MPGKRKPANRRGIADLRNEAAGCRACDLWQAATQTVFGEGPGKARVMLVGEQPGDQEDIAGHPFVSPAGKLLNRALADAGLDRAAVYVTNAVKHFRFQRLGKRRLHKRPNAEQQAACRPWLTAEIAALRPSFIVCLGAVAAQALLGASFRVTKSRGQWLTGPDGAKTLATVHPSSLLRIPDRDAREQAYRDFVADLRKVADRLT